MNFTCASIALRPGQPNQQAFPGKITACSSLISWEKYENTKCEFQINTSPGASPGAGPLRPAPGPAPGPGAGLDFSGLAQGLALKISRSETIMVEHFYGS